MRKAISMAPFYLKQIEGYESEVYLKGNLKIDKIPRLVDLSIRANQVTVSAGASASKEKIDLKKRLFLLESQHLIRYRYPREYENTILAFNSSVPDMMNDQFFPGVITGSIYDPEAFGCISPLAPNAFAFYRFQLDGMISEGNHLIYRIKVIPKKKNSSLMKGFLYIV